MPLWSPRHGQALRLRLRHHPRRLRPRHHEHRLAHLKTGDVITIDGSLGQVLAGRMPMTRAGTVG